MEITEVRNLGAIYHEQLGILVLDGSGSMRSTGTSGRTKQAEVGDAAYELIQDLRQSRKARGFFTSVIKYAADAQVILPPTRVTDPAITSLAPGELEPRMEDANAKLTDIGRALDTAAGVADEFLAKASETKRSVVVVLLTDGMHNGQLDPVGAAIRLRKENEVALCAVAYGKDDEKDKELLRSLVIADAHFSETSDKETLRKFFLASVTMAV